MNLSVFLSSFLLAGVTTEPFQCVEEQDNPPIQMEPAPFTVDLDVVRHAKGNQSYIWLEGLQPGGDVEGEGFFTQLPFGLPGAQLNESHWDGVHRTALSHPYMTDSDVNYYRYTYVDADGYVNSKVVRYQSNIDLPIAIYGEPAFENSSHVRFKAVFKEPIEEASVMHVNYSGWYLNRNNFKSNYTNAIGQTQFDYAIEVNPIRDDSEVNSTRSAGVDLELKINGHWVTAKHLVQMWDDESAPIEYSRAPVMELISYNGCPVIQDERLGAVGDVRFSLQWDNPQANLNLWVKDPCGKATHPYAASQSCNGLDSSRESTEGMQRASENIVWANGANAGEYSFVVEHQSGDETSFNLCIYTNGSVQGFSGIAAAGGLTEVNSLEVSETPLVEYVGAPNRKEDSVIVYGGTTAESIELLDLEIEPVMVVQTKDEGELRAELPFNMSLLNRDQSCHGLYLHASFINENGDKEETLIIGNASYAENLAREPDFPDHYSLMAQSNHIYFPPADSTARRWVLDIPLTEHARKVDLEFEFKAEEWNGRYPKCRTEPQSYPSGLEPFTVTVDVPGLQDIEPLAGGPEMSFMYPYMYKKPVDKRFEPYVGAQTSTSTRPPIVEDMITAQYKSNNIESPPESVQLYYNRELFQKGLPVPTDGEAVPVEFYGGLLRYILDDVYFTGYVAILETRYLYPREFNVTGAENPTASKYYLALQDSLDVAIGFGGVRKSALGDMLHFGRRFIDQFPVVSNFIGDETQVPAPKLIYWSDMFSKNNVYGSAVDDVYQMSDFMGDDRVSGPFVIKYSELAARGHDILSFGQGFDSPDELIFHRYEDDLTILKSKSLEHSVVIEVLEEAGGDMSAALDNLTETPLQHWHLNRDSESLIYFQVIVRNYFADPTIIDEFRLHDEVFIDHQGILDSLTEF